MLSKNAAKQEETDGTPGSDSESNPWVESIHRGGWNSLCLELYMPPGLPYCRATSTTYRLTEAIRIEEVNLKMYRMRPIVSLTELNDTDSSSSTVYSREVSELDHDRLDRLVQSYLLKITD